MLQYLNLLVFPNHSSSKKTIDSIKSLQLIHLKPIPSEMIFNKQMLLDQASNFSESLS